MFNKKRQKNAGFSLVEVLIGVFIIGVSIVSIIGAYSYLVRAQLRSLDSVKATMFLEEGVEVMRSLRDTSWTTKIASLTLGVTYYLSFSTTTATWSTTDTPQVIDETFYRQVVLASVRRDINGDIAISGTTDADARKVTLTVAWPGLNGTSTRTLSAYLTNLYNN